MSLCCALIYGALQYSPHDMLSGADDAAAKKVFPQSYMTGIVDRNYDQTGALKYQMIARSAATFTDDAINRSEIDHPHVTLYNPSNSAPWQLSANQGATLSNTITLLDNVQVWNEQGEYGQLTLTTDDLIIDTDEQFAHTDKPVTMRSERGTTSAVGLSAELDSGRIELLSEVKASYAPQ